MIENKNLISFFIASILLSLLASSLTAQTQMAQVYVFSSAAMKNELNRDWLLEGDEAVEISLQQAIHAISIYQKYIESTDTPEHHQMPERLRTTDFAYQVFATRNNEKNNGKLTIHIQALCLDPSMTKDLGTMLSNSLDGGWCVAFSTIDISAEKVLSILIEMEA